jgi:hypothetical protein
MPIEAVTLIRQERVLAPDWLYRWEIEARVPLASSTGAGRMASSSGPSDPLLPTASDADRATQVHVALARPRRTPAPG